ncbi:DUF3823 domain-containing protein [Niabella ginsengisoli]|uniref:DUF3823 domain-containing protein n=1 Tax=Niabella ginsengisoli TaxID=522298 RepID=A0ABS9SKP3_9BACT|nr:DUF3823 domain-containing protein [Niabella ginsengisoli]MCH5598948.1 DUF3823 domain-containing protein [Niabella ginsengisoli]
MKGRIIDATTGENVQSEVSGENGVGTRIELRELSWSDNPTPMYLATKQDGTYINTKIFSGNYKISADGAFVPLVQTGTNAVDHSQTVDVKSGTTEVNFTVEPFLRIVWEGEPVLNADGTVTVKVKITRGTADPDYQLNVTDINLYVNNFEYIGNNNFDARYSNRRSFGGTDGNDLLDQTLTITTTGGALPGKRTLYLRVGARTTYPNNGRPYNYNEVKSINIP